MSDILNSADVLFDPISASPIAEHVAAAVEAHILNGVLKEGDRLPGERELAVQLKVSRPKLREAMTLLAARNLVRVVAGEGVYIATLSGPALSEALQSLYMRHPTARQDHLEFRRHQEGFAARLAAERATAVDRERISDIISKMRDAGACADREKEIQLDIDFHTAIVEASYNRMLIHTMATILEVTKNAIYCHRDGLPEESEMWSALMGQHEAIADAIISGDPIQAEAAAYRHLDYVKMTMDRKNLNFARTEVAKKRAISREK